MVINYSSISTICFHLSMMSLFILKQQVYATIIVFCVMLVSIIYIYNLYSTFLMRIYDFYDKIKDLEVDPSLNDSEIKKWRFIYYKYRNYFKHPLSRYQLIDINKSSCENFQ